MAGWLADRGAGTIVLNGRREPDDAARRALEELRQRGVTVTVEIADVTDESAVEAMLQRVGSELPPLAGVIHSVGVLSDASIQNQSWERFERVLRPKVLGAWLLHRATRSLDLDFFVLFSSMVGVLGNVGQANHAAANAYLDQLARHRRSLGLPGQAIAWSVWSGLGEAEEQRDRISEQVRAAGGGWISPKRGCKRCVIWFDKTWGPVPWSRWTGRHLRLFFPVPRHCWRRSWLRPSIVKARQQAARGLDGALAAGAGTQAGRADGLVRPAGASSGPAACVPP